MPDYINTRFFAALQRIAGDQPTDEALAMRSGVGKANISGWRNGKRGGPTMHIWAKLAQKFGRRAVVEMFVAALADVEEQERRDAAQAKPPPEVRKQRG